MAVTKPAQQRRASQAVALDPAYALNLSEKFTPDIDTVIAECIACFGIKGAGKSNLCARLHEQYRKFPIPYVLFDSKGEYYSLAQQGGVVIATANDAPTGREILTRSLRVVVDLRTWDSADAAALAMCQLLRELHAYASTQDAEARIPCPLTLDDAQSWLPQTGSGDMSKDAARDLRALWHLIASRDRSLGLAPSFFTQNISEINKTVMRQAGIYILMRQALDLDLERYMEYLRADDPERIKARIRSFEAGRAIVVLPGEQIMTTFYQRETTHTSHTPTVRALLRRLAPYGSTPRPAVTDAGLAATCDGSEEVTEAPKSQRRQRTNKQPEKQPELSPEAAIYAALEQDSGLSPYELMARTGCDLDTAKRGLVSFFYGKSAPTTDPLA
jgi:hypothetical protein